MNIRDFQYLVAVAEFEHFGRAATACHVSQPALSGQIRKLEAQLGIALFERTNRKVSITQAGAEILDYAKEILSLVRDIKETAKSLSDPLSGVLRLGMIPTIGPYLTPLLLAGVREGLPNINLQLYEDITAALETRVRNGQLDAAILATAMDESQTMALPLYEEPFWVALAARHPLAKQKTVNVADIEDEEFLLLADGHCLRDQVLSFCSRVLKRPPVINTQQTSLATILALVGTGTGVTLLPAMTLGSRAVAGLDIVLRKETSGKAMRHVRLVFRKSFPRQKVLRVLADIIRARAPKTVIPAR